MTFKHDAIILVLIIAKYRLRQELFQIWHCVSKAYPGFLIRWSLNFKSHTMTLFEIFERETFCWAKLS